MLNRISERVTTVTGGIGIVAKHFIDPNSCKLRNPLEIILPRIYFTCFDYIHYDKIPSPMQFDSF